MAVVLLAAGRSGSVPGLVSGLEGGRRGGRLTERLEGRVTRLKEERTIRNGQRTEAQVEDWDGGRQPDKAK